MPDRPDDRAGKGTRKRPPRQAARVRLMIRDIVVYAMLGSLMFLSKLVMEGLPNIHPLAMLTMVYTLVYRWRALYPIYVYIMLNGLYAGFATWWLPYLYIWTILWGVTMLLPRRMPRRVAPIVYSLVCGLHGLAFGTLYAPAQAILYGMSFEQTLAWIVVGLPWDAIHAVGDLAMSVLILPLTAALRRLDKRAVPLPPPKGDT